MQGKIVARKQRQLTITCHTTNLLSFLVQIGYQGAACLVDDSQTIRPIFTNKRDVKELKELARILEELNPYIEEECE